MFAVSGIMSRRNVVGRRFLLSGFVVLLLVRNMQQSEAQEDCEWQCDDGQCMESDRLCDGTVHCNDGSDETAENCIHMKCASYTFRCTYGACIAGTAKCNGRQECADGSDELAVTCEKDRNRLRAAQRGQCGDLEVQCRSGECIDDDKICNGDMDCADASDESVEMCAAIKCPQYAFQCGNGACIAGTAKCNNSTECLDESDEASPLCKRPRRRITFRPQPPPTTVTLPPPTTVTPSPPITVTTPAATNRNYCKIPDDTNVVITHAITQRRFQPGSQLPTNTIIEFSCETGYILIHKPGVLRTTCKANGFKDELPTCTKFCNETVITSGMSTKATCYYDDEEVDCTKILVGTRAEISCQTGYSRNFQTFNRCFASGEASQSANSWPLRMQPKSESWDLPKYRCDMKCGYVAPQLTEFGKNGVDVDITEVPWHVGIYSIYNSATYTRICGGSIISARLVLTAAHCFQDEANEHNSSLQLYDASFFRVAAGKYNTDYDAVERRGEQKMEIAKIVVHEFGGRSQQFRNDFAVLLLKQHLVFTHSISPICFTFHEQNRKIIDTGVKGFIVGWGTSRGSETETLQKVYMTSLNAYDCETRLRTLSPDYKLPSDKFCVTRSTSTGDICRGDSGGAFVTKDTDNGRLYRLVGIVSHAPLKVQDCGRDGLVALTNIEYFDTIIKNYYRDYLDPYFI